MPLSIPRTAQGVEVAVLLLIDMHPEWTNKQIAYAIHRDPSRVRQVISIHREWVVNRRTLTHSHTSSQTIPA